MNKILEVKNLSVSLNTYAGSIKAVRNVSFELYKGETLVVVGESGCGKSMTAKSIMQLLPNDITVIDSKSKILFQGQNLLEKSEKYMQKIRGNQISMIFQDPTTYLNPTMKVGKQIAESLKLHKNMTKSQAKKHTEDILRMIQISNPKQRLKQYTYEFSGGMRQRVVIGIALACEPKILIADEPTTALDVTTQADIMELIKELQGKFNTSVMLVTHDLGIACEIGDRIQVMYAGQIVEKGTSRDIFEAPRHPYTWALLRSVPTIKTTCKEKLYSLRGTPPDLIAPPKGCSFASRCEYCMNICRKTPPPIFKLNNTHSVSCWLLHEKAPNMKTPEDIRRIQ